MKRIAKIIITTMIFVSAYFGATSCSQADVDTENEQKNERTSEENESSRSVFANRTGSGTLGHSSFSHSSNNRRRGRSSHSSTH